VNWFRNLRMTPKLVGSFILIALLAGIVAGAGYLGLRSQNAEVTRITTTSEPKIAALLSTQRDMNASLRYTRGAILATSSALDSQRVDKAVAARAQMLQEWQSLQRLPADDAQQRTMATVVASMLRQWAAFEDQIGRLALAHSTAATSQAIALSDGPEYALNTTLTTDLNTLLAGYQRYLRNSVNNTSTAYSAASAGLLAALLVALFLAVGLGWFLARSIAQPLADVQRAAKSAADLGMEDLVNGCTALSEGRLDVRLRPRVAPPTYNSKDEIGETAEAVRVICTKARAALEAYETARAELAMVIGQVGHSSDRVHGGSVQLAEASQQVGQASAQIARAIEEVARGAGEQSTDTALAIAQMATLGAVVQQVANGAEAQSAAIAYTQQAIGQLREALSDTTRSVEAVTSAAGRAAGTARNGGAAVAQTISSIDSVRAAVGQSADQVTALGQRSQEIGQIVAAIDDIASQTNLLALNAAIEAARAGEHGRGFTVVAAEVRKLAERASSETKEITRRIAAIQRQVAEVVQAMAVGSSEVEKSAALGRQAEQALAGILGVVEETNAQAAAITAAVSRMATGVMAVDTASEQVASIARETAQAAGQMREGALQVQASVENIAAVSEETAAGAEQVSASAEEQSASVEEMSAGAYELASLATGLRELMAHFTLEASSV